MALEFSTEQIGNLSESVEPISPDRSCGDVYEAFAHDSELSCLPVVSKGCPVGMVDRNDFCMRLADRFGRALFEKKPISQVMDSRPLVVEGCLSIDQLASVILSNRPNALKTGFVIVHNGRYHGIGTALAMLRMRVAVSQRRAEELDAARRAADLATQAKSDFLANMSHELRTPLNAIIGFSDMMLNGAFGALGDPRYHEYAGDIQRSGQHLLKLINDILDLAKIESDKLELMCERVSLKELICSAIRLTRQRAEHINLDVQLLYADNIPEIEADQTKIMQILLNLLSNAVKFTPVDGEILVTVSLGDAQTVCVEVSDTGIGMTEAEIAIALEPFGQVENGLARQYEGTGLGLPLTISLVEMHGGNLTVESARGKGTRIEFTLPTQCRIKSCKNIHMADTVPVKQNKTGDLPSRMILRRGASQNRFVA